MVRRLLLPVLAAACAASSVAGCGGGGGGGQSHGRTAGTAAGHALFTRACGACHTISGHEDPRRQGGDLLGFRSTRRQLLQLAAEMPVRHPLTESQLEAVVDFVMSMEAAGRR
jgi:mono/diheme cytochrome c family protein